MTLPKNGDPEITQCLNCESEFEEPQKLNAWIKCDTDNGGCGFHFRLSAWARNLEKAD